MKRVIIISLAFLSVLLIMKNTLDMEKKSSPVSAQKISEHSHSLQGSWVGPVNK